MMTKTAEARFKTFADNLSKEELELHKTRYKRDVERYFKKTERWIFSSIGLSILAVAVSGLNYIVSAIVFTTWAISLVGTGVSMLQATTAIRKWNYLYDLEFKRLIESIHDEAKAIQAALAANVTPQPSNNTKGGRNASKKSGKH